MPLRQTRLAAVPSRRTITGQIPPSTLKPFCGSLSSPMQLASKTAETLLLSAALHAALLSFESEQPAEKVGTGFLPDLSSPDHFPPSAGSPHPDQPLHTSF